MPMGKRITPRLFCFGLGYTAAALSRRLQAQGWIIAGTCRSQETLTELTDRGIEGYVFDRGRRIEDPVCAFQGTTHILSSVPPDAEGDTVLDLHRVDILALEDLGWVGYLSTTGVYGDRGGDWVDEDSAPQPTTDRGRRRLAAETEWMMLWQRHGVPVHVFRLAGIYGPGRSALDAVRAGRARRIDKPEQVFSRIRVEDIARVLHASLMLPNPGRIYNVCDDLPTSPEEVTTFACNLLGVTPPALVPFGEAELSDMARSFYSENKRVRNDRIKQELGIDLEYPDYRTGLRALRDACHRPD